MKHLLTILAVLAFAIAAYPQQTISITGGGSPMGSGAGKQGHIGIGAEVMLEGLLPRFDVIQRATFNREFKDYLPDDLTGWSQRYTTQTRLHFISRKNTSFFAVPIAANLRHVKYGSAYGYFKQGYNIGFGGGFKHTAKTASYDVSAVYYLPDYYKWEFSTGKALGNASRGITLEHNGYFGSRWQWGYMMQVSHWKSQQPYDPEPRPLYSSSSIAFGFRFGRKFNQK